MCRASVIVLACAVLLHAQNTRVPAEVRYKHGYVNTQGKPADFSSVMLWGIAIADTRVRGYQRAQVEIARTQLSCRIDGKDVVLDDDKGAVRGGLYRRFPWFGTDRHDSMPISYSDIHFSRGNATPAPLVILRIGTRPERVWHFWAASPRAEIPRGNLEGCTVKIRARISDAAMLQVGFDYWRNPKIGYGAGGNNHEAGASNWYFPSQQWQDAIFSDITP